MQGLLNLFQIKNFVFILVATAVVEFECYATGPTYLDVNPNTANGAKVVWAAKKYGLPVEYDYVRGIYRVEVTNQTFYRYQDVKFGNTIELTPNKDYSTRGFSDCGRTTYVSLNAPYQGPIHGEKSNLIEGNISDLARGRKSHLDNIVLGPRELGIEIDADGKVTKFAPPVIVSTHDDPFFPKPNQDNKPFNPDPFVPIEDVEAKLKSKNASLKTAETLERIRIQEKHAKNQRADSSSPACGCDWRKPNSKKSTSSATPGKNKTPTNSITPEPPRGSSLSGTSTTPGANLRAGLKGAGRDLFTIVVIAGIQYYVKTNHPDSTAAKSWAAHEVQQDMWHHRSLDHRDYDEQDVLYYYENGKFPDDVPRLSQWDSLMSAGAYQSFQVN